MTTDTTAETWFGTAFAELHPLLQDLHRKGGVLRGPVEVDFGTGLAGWLGQRLARRLGVPSTAGTHQLEVEIHSASGVLHWSRRFNGSSRFVSRFRPVGVYPSGHWVERTGPLTLLLGVQVVDGGWHWRHRGTRWLGVPLPRFLLPRTLASKAIEEGGYRFSVEIRMPLLGKVLGYAGTLALVDAVAS